MTRGGKKNDQQEEQSEGKGAPTEQGAMASATQGEKLDELAGMVKSLVRSQAARDQQMEKDFSRQEQRWKSMQQQFHQMQMELREMKEDYTREGMVDEDGETEEPGEGPSQMNIRPERETTARREPKLLPLSPEDDIEHFLTTFERMAQVCRWPRDEWAVRLVPLLTGKARSAYVLMDMADSEDYERVKAAILAKYEITAETYRRRFRSLEILQGETPRELYVRLKDLFSKWVKPEKSTVKELSEKMILEQFLRMMHPELEVWIREHDPHTAEKAAELAEVFTAARRGTRHTTFGRDNSFAQKSKSNGGDRGYGQTQARVFSGGRQFTSSSNNKPMAAKSTPFKASKQELRCYLCNGVGHTQYVCPLTNQTKPSLFCSVPRPATLPAVKKIAHTTPVLVNGQQEMALLDSGGFQTMVLSTLVPRNKWSDEKTKIGCVHGDEHLYPTADVYLTAGGQTFLLPVALAPKLPYAVILGNDVPILLDLLQQIDNDKPIQLRLGTSEKLGSLEYEGMGSACAAGPVMLHTNTATANPCVMVTTRAQASEDLFRELPFCGEEIETRKLRVPKSKAQRRREKWSGTYEKGIEDISKPSQPLDVDLPADVGTLQKQDPTLQPWFQKVTEVEGVKQGNPGCLEDATYSVKGGILYQCKGNVEALVLPQQFRQRTVKARNVANCLVQLFSRVGIPKEVLTDCGTNFTSKLLQQVYQLLGVKGIKTTPYHPQTDGLVERYNQTLKNMLRKFVSSTGGDWDQWLPYLLFAYREVPQASTGFSPFELLYGRQVRGPLDLLRDYWESPASTRENVVSYVVKMRERLEGMSALAQETMKVAQQNQKKWYDQKARERGFEPGQKDEEVDEKFFPVSRGEASPLDLSHLSVSQQEDVRPLLDRELFKETPGFTNLVQHTIRLKQEAPARQKSYRIPERLVTVLQEETKLMLELGIIEASSSEWCSPVVLVPKKDGSLRFCIDFRYLNSVSQVDPYPMPRIDDLVERVGRAKYITTLDLSKGYWQVALAPEAQRLTAFKTPFGMYQFKVMPFGLQGAPATFQRLMNLVLRDVSEFSAAYLDDVVIFSQSWEEHMSHLHQVLQCIRVAGLTINPQKCAIAKKEVEYLGYVIGFGRIKPQVGKVEAIQNFPAPTTKKKVKSFLGLVGWYRKFIPHFAEHSVVFTNLTRASAPNKVQWNEECERAFQDLKGCICTDSVLQCPDFDKPFTLQTDASGVGLGGVLLQECDGEMKPVVFLSRKLLDRETRYSTVEKECLAMKWAIDALRYYLLGRHFYLETDHRALQWLHRMKDANMRIAGWYLALQPYNFTVRYRAGNTNTVADCLSRIHEM
ncbi:uncharacterized protein LOC114429061 [Parambassis ranga]|uniref:Uncharacterized protein LOC114429061 n=1 Tax=Parambassis ranga TaxID=210632 RepID=A0A6P7HDW1_9TELE|nr:uncharacterized protein LOC114429061 [Parambassis ranga]